MRQEVDPRQTNRSQAFELWINSPMPMVTLTKTLDVTRLRKRAKRGKFKLNMLLCWSIGKAACEMEEFYVVPEDGKLFQYDLLAINVIVKNKNGGISTCDVPFNESIEQFDYDYRILTAQVYESCEDYSLDGYMIIGTSALVETELDSIVNQYSGRFSNPFLAWGKLRKGFFKSTLPISFQFHHVQMDGAEASAFLERLQLEVAQ